MKISNELFNLFYEIKTLKRRVICEAFQREIGYGVNILMGSI